MACLSHSAVADIAAILARSGLILRGGFTFGRTQEAPFLKTGAPARSVLLVGNAGAGYWPHFTHWRASQPSDLADPLDAWSRTVIGDVAESFGAWAVSPSDRPYLPFQQWAMRAEGLKPSPLGILMHPEFGLWHAYRGALLFDREVEAEATPLPPHRCDDCAGKPCLGACPVDAYHSRGFAYADCVRHVRSVSGQACRTAGCRDRNACPHGDPYRYPSDVQAYHMRAFAGL